MKQTGLSLTLALALACLLALAASALIGTMPLAPNAVASALFGTGDPQTQIIVWEIRLPRALAALCVGLALGLSGAALQGLLRNPLAEPGTLGISASAALGAAAAIAFGLTALTPLSVMAAAISGATIATGLLAVAASRGLSSTGLILVGAGLSSLSGALLALLMNFSPNPFTTAELVNWMLGSVANRSALDVGLTLPLLGIGASLIALSSNGLRALTLGEEGAIGVGAHVGQTRLLVIAGTGLATGASVALAGVVGFVGLVAPHLVRPLVGNDPARTLWPSAFLSALLLVLADLAIRLIPSEQELKLGVLAALIGAPVFVAIAARGDSHGR